MDILHIFSLLKNKLFTFNYLNPEVTDIKVEPPLGKLFILSKNTEKLRNMGANKEHAVTKEKRTKMAKSLSGKL